MSVRMFISAKNVSSTKMTTLSRSHIRILLNADVNYTAQPSFVSFIFVFITKYHQTVNE